MAKLFRDMPGINNPKWEQYFKEQAPSASESCLAPGLIMPTGSTAWYCYRRGAIREKIRLPGRRGAWQMWSGVFWRRESIWHK